MFSMIFRIVQRDANLTVTDRGRDHVTELLDGGEAPAELLRLDLDTPQDSGDSCSLLLRYRGTDIAKSADSGNCYWARLSGPDTGNDILDNGNSAGQVVVTIRKTDKYVEVSGCNDWTRR